MKVTYPHIGEAYIAIKGLFDDIGIESIIPAYTTSLTLKEGERLSPETICLPFKIMLGNYLNSIKAGADTILITGSCGPCRFGYYGPIQKAILEEAGYGHVDMIILDSPGENYKKFFSDLGRLTNKNGSKAIKAVWDAYGICAELEKMTTTLYYIRPRAIDKNAVRTIVHQFKNEVINMNGSKNIMAYIRQTIENLKRIEIDPTFSPLKIAIIGEIYTIMEPFSNLNIEEKLGDMGVEVYQSMTVKDWAKNTLVYPLTGRKPYQYEKRLSKPYLSTMIGGHAQQCIGHAIHYANAGFDGLIQIYPMMCMPEIVARSILPRIEKDYQIPILYLIVDNQTGEVGYLTRLEAYIDYIRDRKDKAQIG